MHGCTTVSLCSQLANQPANIAVQYHPANMAVTASAADLLVLSIRAGFVVKSVEFRTRRWTRFLALSSGSILQAK